MGAAARLGPGASEVGSEGSGLGRWARRPVRGGQGAALGRAEAGSVTSLRLTARGGGRR